MDVEPDELLDCTGMLCPIPVVKTRRALKPMDVGQVLELIATDPGIVPDMEAWERQTRHEIMLREEPSEGVFRFLIKKTH